MIEGEWSNGKEAGTITEYYDDGFVKSERSFSNGSIDLSKIKKYEPQELLGKVTIIRPKNKKESLNILDVSTSFESEKRLESKDISPWSGTGERQFFNKEGQVLREGYFENGHLINGQSYLYNSKGEKQQTITYKDKKVVKETIHKTKD